VLPSYEEHEKFVRNHPYRAWYLIEVKGEAVGSFYVSKENTIGINLDPVENRTVRSIVDFVLHEFVPLPEIRSVRGDGFYIHVSPANFQLCEALDQLGFSFVQKTYRVPSLSRWKTHEGAV
jgi:hypothetical protein